MNMRTPLGRVRGLGAGHSGTTHFWRERVTSLAGIPMVVFLIVFIMAVLGAEYVDVVQAIRNPLVTVSLLLSIVTLAYHMWLGMQAIIEDYVHAAAWLTTLLVANTFYCAIVGTAALYAVLRISFGN